MRKNGIFIIIILSLILIILGIILVATKEDISKKSIPVKLVQPEFFLSDTPNDSLVLEACEYYGIQHANIVLAQAILETGHYQSGGCTRDKNLFGLYNSRKQEFFKFEKWYHSVEAYRNMIQSRYDGESNYYDWLKKIGYAEDTLYVQKLKRIAKIYNIK
jgi:flagellum-specific peptidoglycan hydrolase FlgJ